MFVAVANAPTSDSIYLSAFSVTPNIQANTKNFGIGNILETFDKIKVLFRRLFPLNFHTLLKPVYRNPLQKKSIDFFFRTRNF